MQEDDVDVVTHFEKNFITSLCQLLKGDGLRNGSKLNPDFRRSIGAFLAEVISKNQQVRKWMLEAKLLGINGLSNLILNETEFRVLDTCLEIATRLAPKRSDPQARRAFFADIFNSTSAKLQFGERTCKFLMKIMEQPQKGSTWFEISDQIFAEMDGNSDRLHRFVMQHLVICGKVFSEKDTSLRYINLYSSLVSYQKSIRLYLDTGITFNGFQRDAAEEVMITTSYDSLIKVQIDYPGEFSSARLVLSSPPVWENPNETTFHKASLVVILHLPTTEMARFQSALKQHGQASKIFDSAKPPKQSFSSHPTQLGRSDPPSPPALEEKAEIMKSFIESSPPLSSRKSVPVVQEPANKGKVPSGATSKAPAISKNDHPKPISKPQVTHQLITLEKEEKSVRQSDAHVRRGVIVDSEDEDETNKDHLKLRQEVPSLRKRKSSELTDLDGALSGPARKKIRVEKDTYREAPKNAKHQPTKDLRQPLARDISAQINTVPKGGNSVGATAAKIFAKPVPPQRVPRLNQMKTRDGTRPTAVSTPRRRRQMAKTEIPRSMQAPSQSFAGNPERPVCVH
ncbi:hypothetical protein M408DRAFT_133209 [Serendipita vermifera MAFF 305830]|uniref:Uncharacterized protein n=1 Tax=Serendipita vermifera MAFF 305830 TaxID=933852 RepID=A0A0C2XI70_SERVB|nr:hypothetical protein M408DRAFT_133209 [Serendipita vermifera MAFF 305830]